MRIVDTATDQVLRPIFSGPIRMSDVQKQWNGSRLTFSLKAELGVVCLPINGWILATVPDLLGAVSQGRDLEEARSMIREARAPAAQLSRERRQGRSRKCHLGDDVEEPPDSRGRDAFDGARDSHGLTASLRSSSASTRTSPSSL